MDIKTADRLQELRKNYGYSQEALSEKLGVSRQAISKWERGESSPDTDNLIALAAIYGITLDEILNPEKEIKKPSVEAQITEPDSEKEEVKKGIYSSIGKSLFKFPFPLIVVGGYLALGFSLHLWHPLWIVFLTIPVYYQFAGACMAKTSKGFLFAFPVPELVVIAYLMMGLALGLWGVGALVFIIIPLYYWGIAFYKRSKK